MIALAVIAVIIVAFLAVILIRTAAFKPKEGAKVVETREIFDEEKPVKSLQAIVRCRTISHYDPAEEDEAEFARLVGLLPELFPNVYEKCELKTFPDRAMLFRWKGKSAGEPAVLMAHYDVVPVNEEGWEKPPFDGVIEDGVLWGRGTLDTKVTFNAALSAADHLIAQGFVPENDVYLAFSGGEEVNGPGAVHIVDYFEAEGISPALVIDEGGAVVQDVFPGVSAPCGLIGIAEKGMIDLELLVRSAGGHASAPKPGSPVAVLSEACCKIEKHPCKMHITKPVAEMFDALGRHSSFLYRMIFANLWCFSWVLNLLCKKSGGELNALLRSTIAFTQMKGSSATNVIPPEASMVCNIRINPADSVDSVYDHIRGVVNDGRVKPDFIRFNEPSRISRTDVPGWDKVASAVASTWKGAIVSPYLMFQCSDSRHYGKISDRVYRFSAMDLTKEERGTIHGHNERIRVETIKKSVEFYIRLIRQC